MWLGVRGRGRERVEATRIVVVVGCETNINHITVDVVFQTPPLPPTIGLIVITLSTISENKSQYF